MIDLVGAPPLPPLTERKKGVGGPSDCPRGSCNGALAGPNQKGEKYCDTCGTIWLSDLPDFD